MTQPDEDTDGRGRIALGRRLIANALRYSTAPIAQTASLRDLKHDADLLPRIQHQLRLLLDTFHRDSNVVYDIQGMRDLGCDLLVRLQTDNDARFIGLQVKSDIELQQDVVVNKLLLQYSTAVDHYSPMLDFYIVLAADLSVKGPQSRVVRAVQQAFSMKSDVKVVDPQYVATLLRLPTTTMDALITQTMRTGDPIMSAARLDLRRDPVEAAVILRLITAHLSGRPHLPVRDLLDDRWIQSVAGRTPHPSLRHTPHAESFDAEFADENELRDEVGLPRVQRDPTGADYQFYRLDLTDISDSLRRWFLSSDDPSVAATARLAAVLPAVLDSLEDELVWQDPDSNQCAVRIDQYVALFALAAEGQAKHELYDDDLIKYLIELVLSDD
ncbi:hypothetical protein AB0M22_33875 [Nocardia sp. NPDC051756]|uniref:hypothetical protein n=1 Tax=Nocardia sp. NPDC051756 TaxID=3154751 RepID=UPI00344A45B0